MPSLLLLWVLGGWALGLLWEPLKALWVASLASYALISMLEGAWAQRKAPVMHRGLRLWALVSLGIIVTHLSYGWHFLAGLLAPRLREESSPATQAPS
jgi:hypothetical protein